VLENKAEHAWNRSLIEVSTYLEGLKDLCDDAGSKGNDWKQKKLVPVSNWWWG
jgi:hypothetical protein